LATALKNLSDYNSNEIPSAKGMKIGIAVAEWNGHITGALLNGALNILKQHGALDSDIIVKQIPGSYELPTAAQFFFESSLEIDAVICIGCLIKGETVHFEYICEAISQGIKDVSLKYNKPVIFGVLTVLTEQQALDRCGGKHGNKGDEAAITAIKMIALQKSLC
jgi:6,7-dimethyl-8-ribityllumazine synthase